MGIFRGVGGFLRGIQKNFGRWSKKIEWGVKYILVDRNFFFFSFGVGTKIIGEAITKKMLLSF